MKLPVSRTELAKLWLSIGFTQNFRLLACTTGSFQFFFVSVSSFLRSCTFIGFRLLTLCTAYFSDIFRLLLPSPFTRWQLFTRCLCTFGAILAKHLSRSFTREGGRGQGDYAILFETSMSFCTARVVDSMSSNLGNFDFTAARWQCTLSSTPSSSFQQTSLSSVCICLSSPRTCSLLCESEHIPFFDASD